MLLLPPKRSAEDCGRNQQFSISKEARLSLRVNLSSFQCAGRAASPKKPGTVGELAMKSQELSIYRTDVRFRFHLAQLVERHSLKGIAEKELARRHTRVRHAARPMRVAPRDPHPQKM